MKNVKMRIILLIIMLTAIQACSRKADENVNIPLPTEAQLRWHDHEKIMFVHFSANTWQTHRGMRNEWDDLSTPLALINPGKLNTDQWCEVAKSWGAGMILFVAKHVGGFCSWQTETTEYGIRNTPWKNGQGDILKELSESCKKYGLDLGIYVYPGDPHWGAPVGSGGVTEDTSKQEEYNKVYRRQMTEVLSNYGEIKEVWFDGSCHIDVNDILQKYAPNAVILQGPMANLRWVGNEDGMAPFSNWNTVSSKDLKTGVSTAIQSDPFGDAYAPVEIDVPLLKNGGHKWFWAPNTDHLILTTGQLMDMYYKSVGRGAVLLLNSTPDTTGLIPASHVAAYKAFGDEIERRFSHPLSRMSGHGKLLQMKLSKPSRVNHVILQEDLTAGQRVLSFRIEGLTSGGEWKLLYDGTSIGHKRICLFEPAEVKRIRVTFDNVKAEPVIKNFAAYFIEGVEITTEKRNDKELFYDGIARRRGVQDDEPAQVAGEWNAAGAWTEVKLDLTGRMNGVGQYELAFLNDDGTVPPLEFRGYELSLYGRTAKNAIEPLTGKAAFRLTKSQQTLDEFPAVLTVRIKNLKGEGSGKITFKKLTF